MSPLLFDLTSCSAKRLQVGFSAKTTLSIAQAPVRAAQGAHLPADRRRALPEDYVAVAKKTMDVLADGTPYREFAKKITKSGWVSRTSGSSTKQGLGPLRDHPDAADPASPVRGRSQLYDLVVKRFLAVFFPPAEYLVTTRLTEVEGHTFKTEGKVLVEPGWLAIYGREALEEQGSLPKTSRASACARRTPRRSAPATKPPGAVHEATLLTAMEGAGKLIDDDDLRLAMAGRGSARRPRARRSSRA